MDYINNDNDSNNNNNNNNNNSKLFYKIIKNKYIFNLILYHLKSDQKRFNSIEDFLNYNRYERLESIDIADKEILKNLSLIPSLRHIALHRCECDISNSLIRQIPDSVLSLEINGRVQGPLASLNIKYLKLHNFKTQINRDYIPLSVENLLFCGSWESGVEALGSLVNLKYLDLGYSFKGSLQDAIPINLETLCIGGNFIGPLNKADLKNIKKLVLFSDCSDSINSNSLPNTLTTLELHADISKPLSQIPLPKSLTSLFFNSKLPITSEVATNLPNLKTIHFGASYDHQIHHSHFPEGLEQLTFGPRYNHPLNKDSLPKQLLTLHLNLNFNHPIVIPSNSITHLDLNNSISEHKLQVNSLPKSLKFLKLPQQFNHEIPLNCLPVSLEYLYLGFSFNQSIQFCLPPNLIEIHFGHHYNTIIEPNTLSTSIKLVSFPPTGSFNQSLLLNSIPPNTTTIQLPLKYNHPINTEILPKDSIKQIIFNNITIYKHSIFLSPTLYNPNL